MDIRRIWASEVDTTGMRMARQELRLGIALRPQLLLALIVGLGLALRVGYLYWLQERPGFSWHDPDHYLEAASALTRTGTWAWHLDAVNYLWGGQRWTMSPAYPVFLSVFYRAPSYDPFYAAVAQIVLASCAVVPVYWIGVVLHNTRAALIAAFLYATWFPSLTGVAVFNQEALYLPLLATAFGILAIGFASHGRPWLFAVAGAVLACAILARAVPLYFLPGLLLLLALGRGRVSPRALAGYAAGLAVVLVPYILFISLERGHLVLIDDHGVIQSQNELRHQRVTIGASARVFLASLAEDLGSKWELVRAHFHVQGRSWVYHYGWAPGAARAAWIPPVVTVWLDAVFTATAILAPWGLALARYGALSRVLAAWGVFAILLSAAAGFGGARYRAPVEFVLVLGAAVVFARGWTRCRLWALIGAALCSATIAWFVVPQMVSPREVRASYGLAQWAFHPDGRWTSTASGAVGFNVPTGAAGVVFRLEPIEGAVAPRAYKVTVDGQPVAADVSDTGAVIVRSSVEPGLHYIEIEPDLPSETGMFNIIVLN